MAKKARKKSTQSENTKTTASAPSTAQIWCWALGFFLLSFVCAISLYSEYGKKLGDLVDRFFSSGFGWPAMIIPFALAFLGVYLIKRRDFGKLITKAVLGSISLMLLSCLFHILSGSKAVSLAMKLGADKHAGGGLFGALLSNWLVRWAGGAISFVLFLLLLLVFMVFIFKFSPVRFVMGLFDTAKEEAKTIRTAESYEAGMRTRRMVDDRLRPLKNRGIDFEVFDEDAVAAQAESKKDTKKKSKRELLIEEAKKHLPEEKLVTEGALDMFEDVPVFDPISEMSASDTAKEAKDEKKNKSAKTTEEEILSAAELMAEEAKANQFGNPGTEKAEALSAEEEADLRNQLDENAQYLPIPYRFPPTTLLKGADNKKRGDSREELRETAMHLVDTLKSFGVDVKLLQVSRGPTVTRYELQPSVGVKVSKITNLSDDIALNLAAAAVRIEAPIPGKAAIGIEIPNKEVSMVSLRETLETDAFKNAKSKLSVALGMDITGNPIIADIAKFPHALIAGATGSGKSVCINSIITSILYKADPNEVKLMMIDPKVVELGVYNDIPHLLIPVVTDPKKASGALAWAVSEMTRRYNLFAKSGVRDLAGYNEVLELDGEPKLPQIVIIIDELADLMMVAPKEIEDSICRLAQMARAAGMYIIIATQRPSVNVITGVIKANIPTRIAFAVSSQIDSRTILDAMGAEKLLGKGDMLFMPFGASKPTRLQGAFVSDKEVESVVEFIKDTSKARYDEDITEKINTASGAAAAEDMEDGDDLLPKAIEIAVASGSISTSMIQRRLGVGYARAGRIIDQMEARGIISGPDGSKPRNVLVSHDELFNED